MNSCAGSSCTCFPKVSCAFATLASWPTADVPLFYRCAFHCSAQYSNRRLIKTVLPRMISGIAPSAVDRWWSSKGSPLQKSNYALHHCSLLPHETTLSNSNSSRLSACSASLPLNAEQNPFSSFLSEAFTIFSRGRQLPTPSAALSRTVSAILYTAPFLHSISIGPASAANTGDFLLTA